MAWDRVRHNKGAKTASVDGQSAYYEQALQTHICQLNPALRGWCAYFKPGLSSVAFSDLANYTLDRFLRWARRNTAGSR